MPTLATRIVSTIIASSHSPLSADAPAAKTSRNSSGFRIWFHSTRRRVCSRSGRKAFGP
jgi:hypothetical protein